MIFFTNIARKKNIPKNTITAGPEGRLYIQDKYNPPIETIVPTSHAIRILAGQLFENKIEIEEGITRNANTIKIPPILTA